MRTFLECEKLFFIYFSNYLLLIRVKWNNFQVNYLSHTSSFCFHGNMQLQSRVKSNHVRKEKKKYVKLKFERPRDFVHVSPDLIMYLTMDNGIQEIWHKLLANQTFKVKRIRLRRANVICFTWMLKRIRRHRQILTTLLLL